jgi:cytochrome c-type biogenesis protein CcmH/NrfG
VASWYAIPRNPPELALALQGYEEAARLDPKNAEARAGIGAVRGLMEPRRY